MASCEHVLYLAMYLMKCNIHHHNIKFYTLVTIMLMRLLATWFYNEALAVPRSYYRIVSD